MSTNAIIALTKLEDVFRRCSATILASNDVAILLVSVYEEAGYEVPDRLVQEADKYNSSDNR
jgi:hypothetical protein